MSEINTNLPNVVMPICSEVKMLKGQKALVTGANFGIGKGVAIELAKVGADVVVNYRGNEKASLELVKQLKKNYGVNANAHYAEVSNENDVKAMFEKMISEFGTIDILINNAGPQKDAPIDEMTLEQWNTVINVNLTGQFLCAIGAIKDFKRRGVVPNISCAA